MPNRDIIVIGASAGGVEALQAIVRDLPADLPAAVFVVLHLSPHSPSMLVDILHRTCPMAVVPAQDGATIEQGHIYIGQPNQHLLVGPGYVHTTYGPRENHHRPAVDPLFRSAAVTYGPRVAGVVLTGALDDGTAGLLAIKRLGGAAIAQDPDEALFPDMPSSALTYVDVDYCLKLAAIAPALVQMSRESVQVEEHVVPEDMRQEADVARLETETWQSEQHQGTPSPFSCPECGGVLWEINEGSMKRFRCRVGHAFSPDSVLHEQAEALEQALWGTLHTIEESIELSRRMATQARHHNQTQRAERLEQRVQALQRRSTMLRHVLQGETAVPPISHSPDVVDPHS